MYKFCHQHLFQSRILSSIPPPLFFCAIKNRIHILSRPTRRLPGVVTSPENIQQFCIGNLRAIEIYFYYFNMIANILIRVLSNCQLSTVNCQLSTAISNRLRCHDCATGLAGTARFAQFFLQFVRSGVQQP
jgi:hypothetical protein